MDTPDINPNLVEVFQGISQNQSTGILYVYEGEQIKYLYFENGKLIYLAFYQSKDEKIGRSLVSSYKISEGDFHKVMEVVNTQGTALKDILLQQNLITPTELKSVTRTLVEDEFCEIFTWAESQTQFQEGPPDPQIFNRDYNTLKINIDVDNLIKWIQKKVDENYTIYQWIPSRDNIYALIPGSYDQIDEQSLSALDRKVAEFLDGNYTIENICYQLRQDYYKVGKSVVKLMTKGLVELASGEGPTTGISQEIRMIQESTGAAPQPQQTPPPAETPVQPEASATQETVQPAMPDDLSTQQTIQRGPGGAQETIEDGGQVRESVSSAESARNILVYESNTKKNVLITAGIVVFLLAAAGGLFFILRETAQDRLDLLATMKPGLMQKRQYNKLMDLYKQVKARNDAGPDVYAEADREIKAVFATVNAEAEDAVKKAKKLMEENKLEQARDFLGNEQKILGRSTHKREIMGLVDDCEKRISEYNEVLNEAVSKLNTKIEKAGKEPDIDIMNEIAVLIDKTEDLFKGYKPWEEKKDTFITSIRKVVYDVEEKKKKEYEERLKDSKNLKGVEDEINRIFGTKLSHFDFFKDMLPEVRRKIEDIRATAGKEYDAITASRDKDLFTASIEKIDSFLGKYPWYEKAEELRTEKKKTEENIAKNNEIYQEGLKYYNDEKYKDAVENFSEISPRSGHYPSVQKKITFLNSLRECIKGWKEAEKREKCAEKLKKYLAKDGEKLSAEHKTLIMVWIDRIEKYDEKSNDAYQKVLETVNRAKTKDEINRAVKLIEKVIENYPNSPGGGKAEEKRDEIRKVIQQAVEVGKKVDAFIGKGEYDTARAIKVDFVQKYPTWVEDYIAQIPVYVEVYPAHAEVQVNGKKSHIIEYDKEKKAEVTASCPGFEHVKRISIKEKGKNRELIILNRKAFIAKETKHAITAAPVLSEQGIVCTYASGIDMYEKDGGRLIWSNNTLEIAAKGGIKYPPLYSREQSTLYVLGEEKLHQIDISNGLSKRDSNLGAKAETPPFMAKDPLIGMRYYIYYGGFSRNVVCINSDDLEVRWNDFKAEGIPVSIARSPERDDAVVAGCRDNAGSVYFINFRSGRKISQLALGSPLLLRFIPYKGNLLAPLASGSIACIDVKNSQVAWQCPPLALEGKNSILHVAVADNKVYSVVTTGDTTEIVAINPGNKGEKIGKLPECEPVFSSGMKSCSYDGKGRLYICTKSSEKQASGVWVFNLNTEKIEWQYFEKGLEFFEPVFSKGRAYFVSKDGRLMGFSTEE